MLRILATPDLGAATWPLRTSYGESATIAGAVLAGVSRGERAPASLACLPAVAEHLAGWLDRDPAPWPAGVSALESLTRAL